MTVKLNLTIDDDVVKRTKFYAKKNNTSVSKMVQEYLDKVTQSEKPKAKSFVGKYAGSLDGQLGSKEVKQLKDEYLKEKYGV